MTRPLAALGALAALAVGVSALMPSPPAAKPPAAPSVAQAFWPAAKENSAVVLASAPAQPTLALELAQAPPAEPLPAPAATQPPLEVPPPASAQPNPPVETPTQPVAEERLQLEQLSADQLHARLQQVLGKQLPPLPDDGTPWARFSIDLGDGAAVLVALQRQTGEIRLVGRPDQLKPWRQIIAALDAPPAANRVTEIIGAEKAATPHIKRAVAALVAQAQTEPQPKPDAAEEDEAKRSAAEPAAKPASAPEGLLGPVQIETIEGTDFFVIRGDPQDVERVMEIIRELEAMSRVSEPQTVVHELHHVDSIAMAQLLRTMFGPTTADSFSLAPFYGPLLPIPLGRPNAVLLIGSPNTVEKAESLLNQLDVAGQATTQFEVFSL
ncbi:MAG: hypothetical protein IT424_00230, partial [Pirellulales bacterium]|nr:hypothetical protein [Pirellulales bacterium]